MEHGRGERNYYQQTGNLGGSLSTNFTVDTTSGVEPPLPLNFPRRQPRPLDPGFEILLPAPPDPTYRAAPSHYHEAISEIPTSDQTYGETNQLLQITPQREIHYGRYRGMHDDIGFLRSGGYIRPETRRGMFEIAEDENPYRSVLHRSALHRMEHFCREDEEKSTRGEPGINLNQAAPTIPRMWTSTDMPTGSRVSGSARDGLRPAMRSSSVYPSDNENDWETTRSNSQPDMDKMQDRPSQDSYADTSVYDDDDARFGASPEQFERFPNPVLASNTQSTTRDDLISPSALERMRLGEEKTGGQNRDAGKRPVRLLSGDMFSSNTLSDTDDDESINNEHPRHATFAEFLRASRAPTVAHQNANVTVDDMSINSEHASRANAASRSQLRQKLSKANPFKSESKPPKSVNRRGPAANPFCDGRGLLETPQNPVMSGALGFNDSTGTFRTLRQSPGYHYMYRPTAPWSPIQPRPATQSPLSILHSTPGSDRSHGTLRRNLTPSIHSTTPQTRPQRAAMDSQYELQDLRLVRSQSRTARTRVRPPTLVLERERGVSLGSNHININPLTGPAVIQPPAVNPAVPGSPRLFHTEVYRNRALYDEQKQFSLRIQYITTFFPPAALAFGLGAFDKLIEKKTNGRILEMCGYEKR